MSTRKPDTKLGVVLISIVLALPAALWLGFVGQRLWGWFVQPLGVPHIGVLQAAGIVILARLFTADLRDLEEQDLDPVEKLSLNISKAVLVPAFALLFGFLYHVLAG